MSKLQQTHLRLLERFRSSMNLIGPGPAEEHFEDCRKALDGLEPTGRWADLGSGAGFPGLVFADLFPDVELDLVDSRRKRCWFLEHVLAEAGVERPQVLCQRVEDLPEEEYDGLIARGFAPPEQYLDHATRLLKPGGLVVLFLQGNAEVPWAPDFENVSVHDYLVGGRKNRRSATLRLR